MKSTQNFSLRKVEAGRRDKKSNRLIDKKVGKGGGLIEEKSGISRLYYKGQCYSGILIYT